VREGREVLRHAKLVLLAGGQQRVELLQATREHAAIFIAIASNRVSDGSNTQSDC
jgi:hypothetical protein